MECQKNTIEKKGAYVILYKITNKKLNYLILKRAEDWIGWELLKGRVKKEETFSETAKREVLEEVGLNIEIIKSNETNVFYSKKDNVNKRHLMKVFFGKVETNKIILSEEHSDFRWVKLNKAINLLAFDDLKKMIEKVNEEIIKYENL